MAVNSKYLSRLAELEAEKERKDIVYPSGMSGVYGAFKDPNSDLHNLYKRSDEPQGSNRGK